MDDKIHTTNYYNTFITIADDCPVANSQVPKAKGDKKSIAEQQYELLANHPYQFTSDDVLFQVFANRNDVTKAEYTTARAAFFAKGQPCFRTSPLTKRYGFGVHADHEGKLALYGVETETYKKLVEDPGIKKIKAIRSSKK